MDKHKDQKFRLICKEAAAQLRRLHIPGAAVGISLNGKDYCAGFGVTSAENPLPVTEDTLFQIGSISKTFLATAAVMLVESGKLELDAPVRKYLPELKLSDENAAGRVTMKHLLTHTCGWFGDYFDDFGDGDDALSKMVAAMAALPQYAPPGELFSYSNSGFYLAGRVIEAVAGKSYEAVIKEMIFDPLGMKMSFFFPKDMMTYRFVVGHEIRKGHATIARPWAMARAENPAGAIACSLKDLLRYARFQISGKTSDGKRLLSEKSLKLLHSPVCPAFGGKKVALSWFVSEKDGRTLLWHGGTTNGQIADLTIIPSEKFAFAALSNADYGRYLHSETEKVTLKNYFGIDSPSPKPLKLPKEKLEQYAGRYSHQAADYDLKPQAGGLLIRITDKGGFPTPKDKPKHQPPPMRAAFYAEDKIIALNVPYKNGLGEFLRCRDGKIAWLRFSRALKRAG